MNASTDLRACDICGRPSVLGQIEVEGEVKHVCYTCCTADINPISTLFDVDKFDQVEWKEEPAIEQLSPIRLELTPVELELIANLVDRDLEDAERKLVQLNDGLLRVSDEEEALMYSRAADIDAIARKIEAKLTKVV